MNFLSVEAAERDGAVHLVAEEDSTFDLDTLHLFAPNGAALKTTGTDNRAYEVAEQPAVTTTVSLTDEGADTLADGGENVE